MAGGVYLRYLNFAENLIILISQLITITLFANLIYKSRFRRGSIQIKGGLSHSLLAFLCAHVVLSSLSLPMSIYLVINWTLPSNPQISHYTPYLLYWLGLWMSAYITAGPLLVLMLTVDRCLSLKFPIYSLSMAGSKRKMIKPIVLIFMLLLTVAAVAASTSVYLMELPLDLKRVSSCELFACLMIKSRSLPQFMWKLVTSCTNLLSCFAFLYLLRNSKNAKIIKNRVVKATMLFEVCFNAIPGIAGYLFNIIVGETPANYVGQNNSTLTADGGARSDDEPNLPNNSRCSIAR
ncbi:hypothetical protein DdX_06916 [Ditylenchus destructor]|uniref:G-protein coupled receptors family 1 profile domain-containing protein n=1 Tax=Ditylenchus destructor TaxID=166010 RepID=A0AAD4N570_9BILA|nr:hypothetical protein DdX_06916 [Ditylenchus destructor]